MTVGDYMQRGFAHANRSIMSSKDIFSGESGSSGLLFPHSARPLIAKMEKQG